MGEGLGFELERTEGSALLKTAAGAAVIRRKGRALPIYVPAGLNVSLSDDDRFRIGKILETYQSLPEITQTGEERRGVIRALIEKYSALLGKGKLAQATLDAYAEICFAASGDGLGPLDFLLRDGELEEIMVNGVGKPICVFHRKAGMMETNLSFTSQDYLVEKANQMLFRLNKRVDSSKPAGHGILANGDRLTVALPPLSQEPCIDIRRFAADPFTVTDLVGSGMLDYRMAAFLFLVMERGGANLGVIGNTGAGKTTLLDALLRFIPPHQRIVSVEEIPEIKIPHSQQVRLLEVEHLGMRMADCILETLRLRPDRVVVGEVRSPAEALALRDSCLSGQSFATYFTYHADDAAFAAERLMSQGIGKKDVESFGLLVCCKRFEEGADFRTRRVVSSISEIGEEGKPLMLFEYDFGKKAWKSELKGKSRTEKWLEASFLGGRPLASELAAREKRLAALKGVKDAEFFGKLWEKKADGRS